MILLKPFAISPLRDAILHTAIQSEGAGDIEAVMVLRFWTFKEIEDKREAKKEREG